MKTTGLDKRIVIFALFAIPVIMVAFISYIAGTQTVYQSSKASEMSKVELISPTPAMTQQFTCLTPKNMPTTKTVDLYAEKTNAYIQSLPLQIYSVGPTMIQYLSLVEAIPTGNKPLTSVRASLLDKASLIRFVGVQGDTASMTQDGSQLQQQVMSVSRQCPSLILE